MKNKYELMNEMKTVIPETDFTESDREKMLNAVHKIGIREKKRRRKKYAMTAACFLIMFGSLSLNQDVRAMVKSFTTGVMEYLGGQKGYQLTRIGNSGLEKPLTQTKNGMTVRLNQLICSDGEVFVDYSVSRKDLRKNYKNQLGSDEYMDTGVEFRYQDKDVSEKLFRKWESGVMDNDLDDPWLNEVTTSNADTMEFIETHGGTGFLYEGKTLDIKIYTYCEGESNEFVFPVKIEALFPEKEKTLNKTVKIDEKRHVTIKKVRSTFSKVVVDAEGWIDDIRFMEIYDDQGEKLKWDAGNHPSGEDGKTSAGPIQMQFTRNRSAGWENYKIKILDNNHKVVEEFDLQK